MVKVQRQNSKWKTVKHTAKKNGTCELLWLSGATSQTCIVTSAIRNVHDQPKSFRTRPAVVNLLHPVEFKTISQPRIIDAWRQWSNTSCVVVTRDFLAIFGRLFDHVPVRNLTSDFHHRTQRKKKSLHDQRFWFWSAVFRQGGHRKTSQKPSKTIKMVSLKTTSLPIEANESSHFILQLSDQCLHNRPFEASSGIFATPPPPPHSPINRISSFHYACVNSCDDP